MNNSFYSQEWLNLSKTLGGIYPWYDTTSSHPMFTLDLSQILTERKKNGIKLDLDLASIINRVYLPFLISNRTLIEGIERSPWMSYPENKKWYQHSLPSHNKYTPDRRGFTLELKTALLKEITKFINSKLNVGILLSGGMDSRVLAGILREYQINIDPDIKVTCISWGSSSSRDVNYAQKIALRFDWEWEHIEITAETLHENIRLSANNGAEVSPMHYHAMKKVSKLRGLDLILAGSYGDSVGRGEYSGTHISNLKDLTFRGKDQFGLLKITAKNEFIPILEKEILKHFDFEYSIRRHEIQQQQHYLRRMLQSCMMEITKKTPLYQIFTTPEVFGKFWSLHPRIRDDQWYILLLQELPGNLLDIPWARTGLRYGQKKGSPDHFTKRYHSYGKWLRTDLRKEIIDAVNSPTIRSLNVFNNKSLDQAISLWERSTTNSVNYYDELFSWLTTLKYFIEDNNIIIPNNSFPEEIMDLLNSLKGKIYGELYVRARNFKRS